jgi:hypothetical protein
MVPEAPAGHLKQWGQGSSLHLEIFIWDTKALNCILCPWTSKALPTWHMIPPCLEIPAPCALHRDSTRHSEVIIWHFHVWHLVHQLQSSRETSKKQLTEPTHCDKNIEPLEPVEHCCWPHSVLEITTKCILVGSCLTALPILLQRHATGSDTQQKTASRLQ